jgi:hypothetical protein
MRREFLVPIEKELEIIEQLSNTLKENGFNASNTIIVCVSSDYSSIVSQLMRHNLSFEGEICDGFSVDVPYPSQTFTGNFIKDLEHVFKTPSLELEGMTLLLCENGVIRGGNYTFLVNWIEKNYPGTEVKTLTLFENIQSKFKSDYVGQYYDDLFQDLTFHYERENNNWL